MSEGISDDEIRAQFAGEDELLDWWEVDQPAGELAVKREGVWKPLEHLADPE